MAASLTDLNMRICRAAMSSLIEYEWYKVPCGQSRHPPGNFQVEFCMPKLLCFMDRLAKESYSELYPQPLWNQNRMVIPNPYRGPAHVFARYLPDYINIVHDLPSECYYGEEIEIFLTICKEFNFPYKDRRFQNFFAAPAYETQESYEEIRTTVNAFIKVLHTRLREPKTRKKILDRKRAVEKNCREFVHYLDTLFSRYARLLVIRVDLGYWKDLDVGIEQLAGDLEHLHGNMRHNKLFKNLLGYIEKIEFGVERRSHAHLLLLFDGSKHSHDSHIAKEIGEYWNKVITKGRGNYWNCNDPKYKRLFEEINRLGIGLIHAQETELRENLKMVILYLCKSEQYCKPITRLKMKLLRKGQCRSPAVKRGAPRTKTNHNYP
ncbi:YagK/YfjJ domain-containing protein [Nitrosomonas sp. ANs5]|uniref:YagK/YfjJ domain-containing protein n=1 Tax=Nitrosomonas sp. ANs5 TaxID=3423941 RepID=UPI003D333896